jgi:hypothetical protein
VSQPFTLGDYKHYYSLTDDMTINVSNGGTVTHNTNEASVKLIVTSAIGSRSVHQSKMYHHYMPGKSQLILSSFIFFKYTPGIIKRTGYFDDSDGIFLEQGKTGVLYFVIRTYTSGTAKETKIAQEDWNGDALKTWKIDLDKTQLLWIDFQWLGVGRVRCGFVHDDDYILCHTFYNSDNLNKVYMANSNLPIRCEIVNDSSTSGSFMNQICSTVASEGGYSEAGRDYSYIYDPNGIDINNGDEKNLLGLKLQKTFNGKPNRMFIRLTNITIGCDTKRIIYRVYRVKNFNGDAETLTTYDGGAEIIHDPTDVNEKILVASGIVEAGGKGKNSFGSVSDSKPGDAKKNFIAQNFNSTDSEGFVISVQRAADETNGDIEVIVSLDWREVY